MIVETENTERQCLLADRHPKLEALLKFLRPIIPGWFNKHVVCRYFGHDLNVNSYFSPTSARESWSCRRAGCNTEGEATY